MFLGLILIVGFACQSKKHDINPNTCPPYKCIKTFSKKAKLESGLDLFCYGFNVDPPKEYQGRNGTKNFTSDYYLRKNKNDEVSLEESRGLIVSLAENFLRHINSDSEISEDLIVRPFVNKLLSLSILIVDENKVELGRGVTSVYLSDGKIKYKGFNIEKYPGKFPAEGKHYVLHEESYVDALEIVKKQGVLKYLE
ncbi:MAG: hypothetical protein K1X28_05135 [Parachlamydiales bacterium]|nr:hypothetical protein [Parachlamydiales bacterium]